MEELDLLKKLERVNAPPDFEQRVLALLSTRREKKKTMMKNLRLSFAGAFALFLVVFIVINVFVFQKKGALDFVDLEKNIPSNFKKGEAWETRNYIPIIEAVDYSTEIQSLSYEPQTIYILEQVSEDYREKIKY